MSGIRNSGTGFGGLHRHFRRTDSTNARARALAEGGAPHGTVVTADEQTSGRGRQGRAWTAPPGKALLYSAIVRPLDKDHLLPLAAPLAVCDAAESLAPGIECQIKWPNDIWLEERKLAGVLIEAKPQDDWAVIGIGLNLTIANDEFPPDLRATAVSLFEAPCGTRGDGDSTRRLASPAKLALDAALDRWISAPHDEVLTAWRSRDALRGREVAWDGGSGVADGIDGGGHLAVALGGGGRVLLGAGDVHLRL